MFKDMVCRFVMLLAVAFCAAARAEVFYEYYEEDIDRTALGDPPGWMPPFDSWTPVRTDIVDGFDTSVRDRDDHFALRFTGLLAVQNAGEYTFWSASDDGSRVVIDGTLVVDNGGWHDMSVVGSGVKYLDAGYHLIVVTYFEDDGSQALQVHYQGPGIGRMRIPRDALAVDANYPACPYPAYNAMNVELNANLDWLGGDSAVFHKVFFGTSDPPEYRATLPWASYDPPPLQYSTDYYWKIVETDGVNEWTGRVWRFRTGPDPATVIDPNLLAWWRFDTDFTDSSGYGNDGTPFGSDISFANTPARGTVLRLNGSDDYVDVGPVGITGAAPRTIAGWVKAETAGIDDWTNVFGFTGPAGGGGHFDIEVVGDTSQTEPGYGIHCYDWERNIFVGIDLEWHHLAATYDGTTVRWYGDGRLVGSGGNVISTPDNVHIGKRQDNDNYFPGLIDDVRIYDYPLSESAIAELGVPNIATDPVPQSGGAVKPEVADANVFTVLDYSPGRNAAAHTGYFSDDYNDVLSRDPAHCLGSPPWPAVDSQAYCVGYDDPSIPVFARAPLVRGRTYYWAVDEFDGFKTWPGSVWSFFVISQEAWGPDPADGDVFVSVEPDLTLAWSLGDVGTEGNSVTFEVYYGTDADTVAESNTPALTSETPGFTVAGLEFDTEYFWRIDTKLSQEDPPFASRTVKGSVWSFHTVPEGLGSILRQWWLDIPNYHVRDLTADPRFPDNPDGAELLSMFEGPTDWQNDSHPYGSRIHGWLYVRKAGDYTFWISSDDESELWLGADENPLNAVLIAYEDDWSEPRDWQNGNEKSAPIRLEAGRRYYISALHKEEFGGDNLAVAWQGPDSDNMLEVIPGSSLKPYLSLWASRPGPSDGQVDVPVNTTLNWTAGVDESTEASCLTQHVYFGLDAAAVANAGTSAPQYLGSPIGPNEYGPLALYYYKRYYWRVDGVNSDTGTVYKGPVWTFKAAFDPGSIVDPNLLAWYEFNANAGDSSGCGRDGIEINGPAYGGGVEGMAIDLDGIDDYIDCGGYGFELSDAITVALWVNHRPGGATDDRGMFSRGAGWDDYGYTFWHRAGENIRAELQGPNDKQEVLTDPLPDNEWHHVAFTWPTPSTADVLTVYVDGAAAASGSFTGPIGPSSYNLRIGDYSGTDENYRNFGGLLDDIRLYDRALTAGEIAGIYRGNLALAWNPNPPDRVEGVSRQPLLTWTPGEYALSSGGHYVYFGADDPANMVLVTAPPQPQSPNSYAPGVLDLGTTYYWAVHEANSLTPGGADMGGTWSFKTIDHLVIDDMETYNLNPTAPEDANWIFYTWVDGLGDYACSGLGGNGSGANLSADSTGLAGSVAMKFDYDNDGLVLNPCTGFDASRAHLYSKAVARVGDLPGGFGSNWTAAGVKALSLRFRGQTGNTAELMWIELIDALDRSAKVVYGTYEDEDPVLDINDGQWHEWLIDLADFNDVDTSNLKSVAIGIGDEEATWQGGSGTIHFDDVALYAPRCILSRRDTDFAVADFAPRDNPSGDCHVDHKELEILMRDWLLTDENVQPVEPDPTGLVAAYRFENDATDSSGNANNGIEFGGPTYSTGRVGSWAISLDGGDDYVDCGDNPSINITGSVSVSAWIKLDRPAADEKIIGNQSGDAGGYKMGVFGDKLEFEIRDSANRAFLNRDVPGGVLLTAGRWYHVAGVYESGDSIRTYVDGNPDRQMPVSAALAASSGKLIIGREPFMSDYFFGGDLDDVRIFKYALSHGELLGVAGFEAVYVPLESPANIYDLDIPTQKSVNFKDYSLLLDKWLDMDLFP
ncbi:MAG: hypothetical protein JW720_16265 [Sedimentisphaerales bacterium]|nr:hypothetical protein [Sedimentisphaerales bacterium]